MEHIIDDGTCLRCEKPAESGAKTYYMGFGLKQKIETTKTIDSNTYEKITTTTIYHGFNTKGQLCDSCKDKIARNADAGTLQFYAGMLVITALSYLYYNFAHTAIWDFSSNLLGELFNNAEFFGWLMLLPCLLGMGAGFVLEYWGLLSPFIAILVLFAMKESISDILGEKQLGTQTKHDAHELDYTTFIAGLYKPQLELIKKDGGLDSKLSPVYRAMSEGRYNDFDMQKEVVSNWIEDFWYDAANMSETPKSRIGSILVTTIVCLGLTVGLGFMLYSGMIEARPPLTPWYITQFISILPI